MRIIFLIVLFISLIIINAQPLSEKNRFEILQVLEKQRISWNEGNINAYMEGYWKSDSLRFIGKSGITYGWEATLERYKKAYPDKETMGTLKFEVISLEAINAATAFMIGKWGLERKRDSVSGHFTLIWKKINDKWLITTDHSS